jgi:hypothetical protein
MKNIGHGKSSDAAGRDALTQAAADALVAEREPMGKGAALDPAPAWRAPRARHNGIVNSPDWPSEMA